ncbi:MAG: flippase-like domain-containing protein [Planctomycetes bacterium]|nr:flippase-like domain-containing protein [Planctomycetota bacterium]
MIRRHLVRVLLSWLLTLALLSVVAYAIFRNQEKFARLLDLRPAALIGLLACWLGLSIPRGLVRKMMAKGLGVRLRFVDWYGLPMLASLIEQFVPARVDVLFSAAYLKRRYGLAMLHFVSIMYGNAVLMAIVLAAEGCLVLLVMGIVDGTWNVKVLGVVLAVGIVAVPFAILSDRFLKREGWLAARIKVLLEGWRTLRSNRRLLFSLACLIVVSSAIFAAWMYVAYAALSFPVRLLPVIFVGIATQLSFFFSLTPGNLGIREVMVGFISEITGLGFAEGMAVTLLQRAISTAAFLVLGSVFGVLIIRRGTGNHQSETS